MSRHFKINGIPYLVLSKFTVLKLITYLGFNQNLIVIDYNGNLLEKNLWISTYVKNGDSLEILSIAGGG
tara:strand:- start:218 stop:424 length:207 start_codon:yes stop_codon:yes gene_type:complete